MSDLIKINYDADQPTVSARDLHEGLEIKTEFRKWLPKCNCSLKGKKRNKMA